MYSSYDEQAVCRLKNFCTTIVKPLKIRKNRQ